MILFSERIFGRDVVRRLGFPPQTTTLPSGSMRQRIYDTIRNNITKLAEPYHAWTNACSTENVHNQTISAVHCTGRVLEEDAMNY